MVNHDIIAQNIIKYRTFNNISQKDLSEIIKIAPTTLSAIECGRKKASMELLLKIANCLNISIDTLFGENVDFKNFVNGYDSNNENHVNLYNLLKCSTLKQKIITIEILRQYTLVNKKNI